MKTGNDRTPETVTIVMPVYNPGKYLAPCLDSLLAQTFGDFRLIAIDDGSTDGSGEVLRAYAEKDSRILAWKNPENLGAARTRNIGMQMAKGKYLSVVDADDFYEPDYLETMVGAMERYGVDVAECDFFLRDEQTGEETLAQTPAFLTNGWERPFRPEEACQQIFLATHNNPYTHMFRRAFILEHSLQFQDISSCNDVYFVKMAIVSADSMVRIPKGLVHYRYQTGQQISTTRFRSPKNFFSACEAIRRKLSSEKRFTAYAPAFHDFVVATLDGALRELSQVVGCRIWDMVQEGFRLSGMERLHPMDFRAPCRYPVWRALRQGRVPAREEWMPQLLASFFRRFLSSKRHIALWGYGKLGKEFLQDAEQCHVVVEEVYDKDSHKWQRASKPPVLPFEERSADIDAVVVTNSKFFEEIRECVQSQAPQIRVYNFHAYVWYGACFCEGDSDGKERQEI